MKFFFWLLTICFTLGLNAAEKAKVKFIRGQATMLAPGMMKATSIKKGDFIPEDTSVVTKNKAFVRVVFPDKTAMNIGPNSMVVIKKVPKKKSNVVNLLTGIIKAEVKKTEKKETKTKMVVKTRTAIMGVRGTKFQSTYNPSNKATSLVTVEGKVAMVKVKEEPIKITKDSKGKFKVEKPKDLTQNLDKVDQIFEKKEVVEVPAGRYSGVGETVAKPTIPVKIAPTQYNAIAKSMGSTKTAEEVMKPLDNDPKPEGFENKATGDIAPKSGGFVDFNTGIYVPPSAEAKLDKATGTFKAEKVGKVDTNTGDYIPPKGIKIDEKKGFIIDKKESDKLASNEEKEELRKTVAGLNKEFKKQVKVNKTESSKLDSSGSKWLPKNHILTAKFIPYSDILTVKNKETNSEADFYSKSAQWTILTWAQEWNELWSSRLRIGGQDYEFDESDLNVYSYGGDDGEGYFSLGVGYKYSKKVNIWIDIVDKDMYYLTPSNSDGVELRTSSLGSFDFTAEYKLKDWNMFQVNLFGTFHLYMDDSVPGVYGGDEGADLFGFTTGSDFYYAWKKNMGVKTSAFYSRVTADADSIEYTRNSFGLGFEFVYDI